MLTNFFKYDASFFVKSVMDQQRLMAHDQVKVIQDRQSSMMKQQQSQMEIMLKQIQSQMESEMRMKSDLVNKLKLKIKHLS
jgi:hypothetical protein